VRTCSSICVTLVMVDSSDDVSFVDDLIISQESFFVSFS
jgi:hypothetical protein